MRAQGILRASPKIIVVTVPRLRLCPECSDESLSACDARLTVIGSRARPWLTLEGMRHRFTIRRLNE
jgi:hypothetical protein